MEPLGNVVIEAWARNLPVVATAAQGPGWLIEDGTDGLLAPVDDAALLGEAIARLGSDAELGPRLVAAGRRRFEADFTEDAVVAKFLGLFEKVLG
ncbi:MAG: glycosyltransferase involved in cell wall biosynthesis [Sphingomonas echinoides]